jgi:hypothetical protein
MKNLNLKIQKTSLAGRFSFFVLGSRKTYALLVFIIGFIFLLGLEGYMKPKAIDGVYFQSWSSEEMMQTVSIVDLRYAPWKSLFYLHIQPPALDAIRALLASLWPQVSEHVLLTNVDNGLYLLWIIAYALLGSLIYLWLGHLTNAACAFLASLLFLLHPATIFYASFLDTTFLTAVCILWSCYELWKIVCSKGNLNSLVISLEASFFVRSIFQLPTLLLYAFSLFLARIPFRLIVRFIMLSGVIMGAYTLKQYYLFGLPATSSFGGSSCFHVLGYWPDPNTYPPTSSMPTGAIFSSNFPLPQVLTRQIKLTGVPNFNELGYLRYEKTLSSQCLSEWVKQFPGKIIPSLMQNIAIYFLPSSRYLSPGSAPSVTANILVDNLPWRDLYDNIFSNIPLILLLVFSAAWWLASHSRQDLPSALSLFLPVAYVFMLSVGFEKGENMRYKFFLEPVFYVFVVSQVYSFSVIIKKKFAKNLG